MKLIKRTMEDVRDLFLSLNMVHTTSTAKVDIHQFERDNQGLRSRVATYEGPVAFVCTFVPVGNGCCSSSMQKGDLVLVPIGGRLYVAMAGSEGYEVYPDSNACLETEQEKLIQRAATLRAELEEIEHIMQRLSNSAGLAPGDHFTFVCHLNEKGMPKCDCLWVGDYLTVTKVERDGAIAFENEDGNRMFSRPRHGKDCLLKKLSAPLSSAEAKAMYETVRNGTVKI